MDQIPQERLYLTRRADRWPIARLIYHLTRYEQRLALLSMLQWLGQPRPTGGTQKEDEEEENLQWNDGQGHAVSQLIIDFKAVRTQQLEVMNEPTEQMWNEERDVI